MNSRIGRRTERRQFLLYTLIGASGVLLDFLLFLVLVRVWHAPPVPANFVSVLAGISNNYVLNARYNFRDSPLTGRRYVRFLVVGGFGLLLSALLLQIFSVELGAPPELVKLVSLPVILVSQFSLNRWWTFS